MKKLIIFFYLLLIFSCIISGQWYVKRYQVTDINQVTKEQLEESLQDSKRNLLYSGIVVGTGGVILIAFLFLPSEPGEDPTFLEQLIGEEGMNNELEYTHFVSVIQSDL